MNSKQALAAIKAERKKQISKGHTIQEDRERYESNYLLKFAEAIYLKQKVRKFIWINRLILKPNDVRLIIAGAFCLAEIEVFGDNPNAKDLLQTIISDLTEK